MKRYWRLQRNSQQYWDDGPISPLLSDYPTQTTDHSEHCLLCWTLVVCAGPLIHPQASYLSSIKLKSLRYNTCSLFPSLFLSVCVSVSLSLSLSYMSEWWIGWTLPQHGSQLEFNTMRTKCFGTCLCVCLYIIVLCDIFLNWFLRLYPGIYMN